MNLIKVLTITSMAVTVIHRAVIIYANIREQQINEKTNKTSGPGFRNVLRPGVPAKNKRRERPIH